MLAWQTFGIAAVAVGLLAAGLLAAGARAGSRPRVGTARVRTAGVYLRETAVILGLYAAWQWLLDRLVVRISGAFAHARWLWRVERALHLPSEVSFQRAALEHPLLVQAANRYYSIVHFPALIAFLVWVFVRHRDRYRSARLTLILVTGACALLQAVPLAPPRMLPSLGFVDTALRFGQSDYGPGGTRDPGQLIAMPSVHVGWSLLIAVGVIMISRSRWRWLALLDPVATMAVVVVTGNHFWADGIVAGAFLALALALQHLGRVVRSTRRAAQERPSAPPGDAAGVPALEPVGSP
ncbi:MAG: hypothetical protein QOG64_1172 [Acidimicrobiaceae bacterium]|nr:hypothetical protein [Acidimicrobiaceae bacterium]